MSIDQASREAEPDVDRAYLEQPLLRLRYTDAVLNVLIGAQSFIAEGFKTATRVQEAIIVANVLNMLRHATRWVWCNRSVAGRPSLSAQQSMGDARALLELAYRYNSLFTAYAYAHRDVLDLHLDGETFSVSGPLLADHRYEAYNYLFRASIEHCAFSIEGEEEQNLIRSLGRAWDSGLTLHDLPKAVHPLSLAYELMGLERNCPYTLPGHWSFRRFSLADFKKVHNALRAIVYIWVLVGAIMFDEDPWIQLLPYVIDRAELRAAIQRTTAVGENEIDHIFEMLQYGSSGVEMSDPALQPLIPVADDLYALAAPLFLATAAERNLVSLLNMLPAEREAYSRLVNDKEAAMRTRIIERLPAHFTAWHGRLPGRRDLPDVDLALIDLREAVVLFLELKWFIEPSEVREIVRRSEELAKGISQAKQISNAARSDTGGTAHMPGAPFKRASAAVVSANWIGHADVQDAEVPVINEEHLAQKLASASHLSDVVQWLETRAYLPRENVHFRRSSRHHQIGRWRLNWYGLDPLVTQGLVLL